MFRVTSNTATAMDHIITNSVINAELINPITFLYSSYLNVLQIVQKFIYKYKNSYTNEITQEIQQKLREVNQNKVKQSSNANESYALFSKMYASFYEE